MGFERTFFIKYCTRSKNSLNQHSSCYILYCVLADPCHSSNEGSGCVRKGKPLGYKFANGKYERIGLIHRDHCSTTHLMMSRWRRWGRLRFLAQIDAGPAVDVEILIYLMHLISKRTCPHTRLHFVGGSSFEIFDITSSPKCWIKPALYTSDIDWPFLVVENGRRHG